MFPPVDSTRRRFLSQAAGVAAGGAVLALATIPPSSVAAAPAAALDPIYGIIDAHRAAYQAHLDAIDEQDRLERLGDPSAGWVSETPCVEAYDAFDRLIETAPVTFPGLIAWVACLDEIRRNDPANFEDLPTASTTLISTLTAALQNVTVAS
jgi:hypothetical protein